MRLFESSDWARFASTMGEANCDIRDIFRDLLSQSPGRRARGREAIAQWPHEEARSIGQLDALPLAVKCLLELLSDDRTPDRAELLAAMLELFDGAGYLSSKHFWRRTSAGVLHRQVRNEFVAGLPVFVELLTSDDEALRRSAAHAMYFAPSPLNFPALDGQLQQETSDIVIAAILEAMVPLRPVDGPSIARSRLLSDHLAVRIRAAQLLAVCELPFPNDGLAERGLHWRLILHVRTAAMHILPLSRSTRSIQPRKYGWREQQVSPPNPFTSITVRRFNWFSHNQDLRAIFATSTCLCPWRSS